MWSGRNEDGRLFWAKSTHSGFDRAKLKHFKSDFKSTVHKLKVSDRNYLWLEKFRNSNRSNHLPRRWFEWCSYWTLLTRSVRSFPKVLAYPPQNSEHSGESIVKSRNLKNRRIVIEGPSSLALFSSSKALPRLARITKLFGPEIS